MDEDEGYDAFDADCLFPGISSEVVMKAKETNPGMFVSGWEGDENDINSWTESEIQADPQKRIIVSAEKNDLDAVRDLVSTDHTLLLSQDCDGYTALHRASYEGHVDMVTYLLSAGADVSAVSVDGWTPLHSAAFWNQAEIVSILLQNGADVNCKTKSGQTALHLSATNNGSPETLSVILSHVDVDIYALNSTEETPLDLASRHTPFAHLFYPFTAPANQLKPNSIT